MPHHPTFTPAEFTIPDSEEDETVEIKESTSAQYYSYMIRKAHWDILEHERRLLYKLGLSFFLFGLINNGEHICETFVRLLIIVYI